MQRNHHAHITRYAFDNGNKKLFTPIHKRGAAVIILKKGSATVSVALIGVPPMALPKPEPRQD